MQTTFCIYKIMRRRRDSLEPSREFEPSTLKVPIWPSQDFRYVRDLFLSPRDRLLVTIGHVVPSELVDRKKLNELSLLSVKPLVQLVAQHEMMRELMMKMKIHLQGLKRPSAKHAVELASTCVHQGEQKRKVDKVSGGLDEGENSAKKLRHVSRAEDGSFIGKVSIPSKVTLLDPSRLLTFPSFLGRQTIRLSSWDVLRAKERQLRLAALTCQSSHSSE